MGRPKLVTIDRDALLISLVHYYRCVVEARRQSIAEREAAYYAGDRHAWPQGRDRWPLHEAERYGVEMDLERLVGHPLTSTERIRAQEAVRSFEAQDLVLRCGKRLLKPTEAGVAKAAAILAAQTPQEAPNG
jgi:hypothetical protein